MPPAPQHEPGACADVRDMVCAQALAVVARALQQLAPGASLDVLLNAEDVRRDIISWASAAGHLVREASGGLRVQRTL